jgi:hypothetical protein
VIEPLAEYALSVFNTVGNSEKSDRLTVTL